MKIIMMGIVITKRGCDFRRGVFHGDIVELLLSLYLTLVL